MVGVMATSRLGDVVQVRGGGTPSTERAEFWQGDIPWVSPKDMKFDLISDAEDKISKAAIEGSATSLIPTGACLVVVRSGILARTIPVGLTTREVAVNQDIKALCPSSAVDSKYLFYFLKSAEPALLRNVTRGATVHRLATDDLKDLNLPIPPLAEQKRIGALLDEAFEGIAKATANAERNLGNAYELFRASLNARFDSSLFEVKKLGDLSSIDYGYTASASPDERGPKFLRITDIQDGVVDWERVPYCEIDPRKIDRFKLRDGDIVFARTGATTGKSYLISNPPESVFASYLIRVQVDSEIIIPELLYLFFQSENYWTNVRNGTSGSAQGGFNASKLAALEISFPSEMSDQMEMVQQLNLLWSTCRDVESVYLRKIEHLNSLKATLLHKAFSGQLTGKEAAAA